MREISTKWSLYVESSMSITCTRTLTKATGKPNLEFRFAAQWDHLKGRKKESEEGEGKERK